jgi:integrase
MLAEMKKFIAQSLNGKRRMPGGARVKSSTVLNYTGVLNVLERFQAETGDELLIPLSGRDNSREHKRHIAHWTQFRHRFTVYLYKCGYKDVYVGLQLKVIRTLLNWLKKHRGYNLKGYDGMFTMPSENLPVVALNTEQLQQLLDPGFRDGLNKVMKETLDLFLFGCATGLRYSDLEALSNRNIVRSKDAVYLTNTSQKTQTETRIKLPDFALVTLKRYKSSKQLLPYPSKSEFNHRLKELGVAAGWTSIVGKYRMRDGKRVEVKTTQGKSYRFCDLLTSHVMRKTTITTLLMAGVPEHAVRRISGHAPNSKEFFRYVQYSQRYMDEYTDKVFDGLAGKAKQK